jgi:hypothetical protein
MTSLKRFVKSPDTWLIVLIVILSLLDIGSTTIALAFCDMHEANPLMRGVAGSPLALLALRAGAVAGVLGLWWLSRSRWVPVAACGVWLLPVINNSLWLLGWWLSHR